MNNQFIINNEWSEWWLYELEFFILSEDLKYTPGFYEYDSFKTWPPK